MREFWRWRISPCTIIDGKIVEFGPEPFAAPSNPVQLVEPMA